MTNLCSQVLVLATRLSSLGCRILGLGKHTRSPTREGGSGVLSHGMLEHRSFGDACIPDRGTGHSVLIANLCDMSHVKCSAYID